MDSGASGSASGASGGAGDGGSSGGIPGSAAAIYDGFESSAISSTWKVIGQDAKASTATTAVLDKQHVHGGSQALHVTDGYIEVAPPAASFYVRVWAYFGADAGMNHWANVMGADSTDTNETRFGGRTGILEINQKNGDDEILADPNISYCASTPCPVSDPRIPIGQWTCLQYYFGPNSLAMWLNGTEVPEFAVTSTTKWAHGTKFTSPTYADVAIGYAMYGSNAIDVWYDDVAIDPNMISCN